MAHPFLTVRRVMKREKNIFILMVLLFCILFFPTGNVRAEENLLPTAWDNRGVYLEEIFRSGQPG